MATIQLTTTNYNGESANVWFFPCNSGATSTNLGAMTFPTEIVDTENYEGTYQVEFTGLTSGNAQFCYVQIPCSGCNRPTGLTTTTLWITFDGTNFSSNVNDTCNVLTEVNNGNNLLDGGLFAQIGPDNKVYKTEILGDCAVIGMGYYIITDNIGNRIISVDGDGFYTDVSCVTLPTFTPTPTPMVATATPTATPTPTPEAPTATPTPTPEAPTATPTPTPMVATATPTATPTPTPEAPTATPTPTPMVATATPTATPTPTPIICNSYEIYNGIEAPGDAIIHWTDCDGFTQQYSLPAGQFATVCAQIETLYLVGGDGGITVVSENCSGGGITTPTPTPTPMAATATPSPTPQPTDTPTPPQTYPVQIASGVGGPSGSACQNAQSLTFNATVYSLFNNGGQLATSTETLYNDINATSPYNGNFDVWSDGTAYGTISPSGVFSFQGFCQNI